MANENSGSVFQIKLVNRPGRWKLYAFFAVHMLMFGLSGFLMAYASEGAPVWFLYAHGGLAILIYLVFYTVIFGRDEVRWMLINAGLGIFGIYSQLGWILAFFGKNISDYPWYVHVTPFLYYVLYTFLLRQFVLDLFRAREVPSRRRVVDACYVLLSVVVYGGLWLLAHGTPR